jgi:peptidoglycan/LPS O-acetylase OafA/YrhL
MRNRYFDLLRAVAIARVVAYHATGASLLTIVFPAMSVMFALAGSLMAATLTRRSALAAVGSRVRRLLPPLWLAALLALPLMLAGGLRFGPELAWWFLPLHDPPQTERSSMVFGVIWYLRQYLWFVLLSPLLLPLLRRWPAPTVIAPYLLLAGIQLVPSVNGIVHDAALYLGAWLLGFAHHDGLLRRMPAKLLLGLAGGLTVVAALWILAHPGPRDYDLNDISLGNGLWSAAFILVAFGFAPNTLSWVRPGGPIDRFFALLNQRAVTVYLWHQSVIYGLAALLATVGIGWDGLPWYQRIPMVTVLLGVPIVLFGWAEDLAARRRPQFLPGLRRPAPAPPVPRQAEWADGSRDAATALPR